MAYSDEVQKAVAAGQKIAAIKLLRSETGMGLTEAKDAVEDLERSLGIEPSAATGASGLAGLVKLVGFGIACVLVYRYFVA